MVPMERRHQKWFYQLANELGSCTKQEEEGVSDDLLFYQLANELGSCTAVLDMMPSQAFRFYQLANELGSCTRGKVVPVISVVFVLSTRK